MLSEEEKKAIDKLKGRKKIGIYELIRTFKREEIENFVTTRKQYIEIILNLIEKQQAEIENLKDRDYIGDLENQIELASDELEKKDKIIDKMAEDIILLKECGWLTNITTKQDTREFYTKLVEEEK